MTPTDHDRKVAEEAAHIIAGHLLSVRNVTDIILAAAIDAARKEDKP